VKRLIVTGDDFGLAVPVNQAIEEAHRRGILTAASLMVGAEATADAIERARRLPSLGVGLHVVLVEGRPVLPPAAVPDLVDERGEFSTHLVRAGVRFFFRSRVRRQLRAEIRAQFEAFSATRLPLDHVNAHNHMHLHPSVLALIVEVGRDFGLTAVRVPYEPLLASWTAARTAFTRRLLASAFLAPWVALLKRRLAQAGLKSNQFIFGLHDSGNMHAALVARFLEQLPDGVTEMYFHPATGRCPQTERYMPAYRHEAELQALTSPSVMEALRATGACRIAFSDL
jgi:hopanoid biosynthesis associated protein HpnK